MAEQSSTQGAAVTHLTCKARYERLQAEREPYLRRAREAAALTIPYVMPPKGSTGSTDLPTPWSGAGAEGVNSLSSKLLLAMLPPGGSFFRLQLGPKERDEITSSMGEKAGEMLGEIEATLGRIERTVLDRLEAVGARIATFDAMKHLIVCGNVLVQILRDSTLRLHYLDNYVVKRDPAGNVLDIIVREAVAKEALPPHVQALLEDEEPDTDEEADAVSVDLYTRIYREDRMYRVYQEVRGRRIPESDGTYPLDKSPWVPLRYVAIAGEDYGRGRVEEYLGDFTSLESLSQSITEGTAMAAKVIFLMNEAGVTQKRAVAEAANGEFVDGDVRDIGVLKLDKLADFSIAAQKVLALEERINKAFLVHQQRQAERVTAEEVRAVIAELEKALGGVYAVLSQEFQLPVVRRVLHQMQRSGDIPPLPEKIVEPKIITGLDALGRGADFEKLRIFVAGTAAEFGPEAVSEYINVGEYMKRKATALQVDLTGILRSEEEVQQARAERMQVEMINKLGPSVLRSNPGEQGAPSEQPGQPA